MGLAILRRSNHGGWKQSGKNKWLFITMMICGIVGLCQEVNGQFYSDYSELTGGAGQQLGHHTISMAHLNHAALGGVGADHSTSTSFLPSYDLPVYYKDRTFPAAYPVASTVYSMALMRPLEAMPGKKTVPLYFVPENALEVSPNKRFRIKKRSLRVNIKYPEWYGLTDGYHIPAVEIPLNKPMVVSQIQVNVLAPSGFMVPYSGEGDREWPYPMNTGCLVASIPSNEYVGSDHPITIRRLFAVPSLPEYPTYKPVSHNHLHIHGLEDPSHTANHAIDHLFAQVNPPTKHSHASHHGGGGHHHHTRVGGPAPPVFELVPVTQKSSRRSGKKGSKKNKDGDDDDDDEEGENVSALTSSEEEEEERASRKKKDKKKKTTTTEATTTTTTTTPTTTTTAATTTTTEPTTTTTTTTTEATTTTTTEGTTTTTAAASSIQDIIAAFSTYQRLSGLDREERQRNLRGRTRLSASFRDNNNDDFPPIAAPLPRSRSSKSRSNSNNDPLRFDEDRVDRTRSRFRDYDSNGKQSSSSSYGASSDDDSSGIRTSSEEFQAPAQSSSSSSSYSGGGQRAKMTEAYNYNSANNAQRSRDNFDIERPVSQSQNSESVAARPLSRPDRRDQNVDRERFNVAGPGTPYLPLKDEGGSISSSSSSSSSSSRKSNGSSNNEYTLRGGSGNQDQVDREGSGSRRREETYTAPLTNSEVQGLRQKMLHKQINQLQKLLSSLNLSRD